jgi:hypothetical protein
VRAGAEVHDRRCDGAGIQRYDFGDLQPHRRRHVEQEVDFRLVAEAVAVRV